MEHRHTRHTARGRLLGGGILAAALLTATAVSVQWQQPADPAVPSSSAVTLAGRSRPSSQQTSSAPADSDAPEQPALAEQLVGVWQLQKHGIRTLRVNPDGTATVQAKLNLLGALMYGEQLTLQLNWTLDGNVMTQTISSGTPEEAVKRLIRDWGDRRAYRVIEVSDEQLVLSEVGDDGDRDVWTSVAAPASSPPAASTTTASQIEQSLR